jgi:N-acetylglucosaminyldiphosphoundecaprenol N-acetyl-beta-D-mannosaminyltransferase
MYGVIFQTRRLALLTNLRIARSRSELQTRKAETMELRESLAVQGQPIDDLSREVFGLLGLTIDALNFRKLMLSIDLAVTTQSRCLISTPNVNFLIASRRNTRFRESLLRSDICIADGMPLIWIARLLKIPIRERVTGADLFNTLKVTGGRHRRLRVFLFGGGDGVAESVSKSLNVSSVGMECVGALNPGYGSIEDMSTEEVINKINSSGADMVAVFLGAEKAQTWLLRNHDRIRIPIRAQFGAAINFEAGTIKRAPAVLRNSGLEWLWRIKEEPYLWRRYWSDGLSLLRLLFTGALPLALNSWWTNWRSANSNERLQIELRSDGSSVIVTLSGSAIAENIVGATSQFRDALAAEKDIVIDCSRVGPLDPRFVGLLLMVRKQLAFRNQSLHFVNVQSALRRALRLNGFGFLLSN